MSCPQCIGIEEMFDLKGAQKELKKFLRKGPSKPTRLLLEAIQKHKPNGTLLDIGSGIGVIPLTLMEDESGIDNTITVDASSGYCKVAREEAVRQQKSDRLQQLSGDYLDLAHQITPVDVVTLDKVICCYTDAEGLVKESVAKSTNLYGVVFPKAGFIHRMVNKFAHLFLRLKGSPFRTFIHDPIWIDSMIREGGFERINTQSTTVWNIWVYQKTTNS